jgi:hypothetical protein
LAGARVAAGQQLRTINGRAEIMLQPESYLRLAPNTSVRMVSDDLAKVRAEVSGIVMLDAASDGAVELTCGRSVVSIAKRGMYRLDCGIAPRVRVYRGWADVVNGASHRKLGDRNAMTLRPGGQTFRFDRKDLDEFDQWSAERSILVEAKLHPRRKPLEADAGNRAIADSNEIGRILYGPWQL